MDLHDEISEVPLWPEDVAMIRALVREHRDTRRCERLGGEVEGAARQLLSWFQSGVTDRDSLRRLLSPTDR
jgi:hypothetical protein